MRFKVFFKNPQNKEKGQRKGNNKRVKAGRNEVVMENKNKRKEKDSLN